MSRCLWAAAVLAAMAIRGYANAIPALDAGVSAFQRSDYQTAIVLLTAALNRPDVSGTVRAKALYDRGRSYLKTGQLQPAVADFTEAIRLRPDADSYIERGTTYASLNMADRALADYSEAIRLERVSGTAYGARGRLYMLMQRWNEAIADFSAASDREPENSDFPYLRGQALYNAGRLDNAIAAETRALKLNPDLLDAYEQRARSYEDKNDFARALQDYEASNSRHSTKDARFHLGVAQWYLGRYADAAKTFSNELARDPGDSYSLLWLTLANDGMGAINMPMLRKLSAGLDFNKWPGSIAALYLGQISLPQLLALAESAPPNDQAFERCDVNFFVGNYELHRGNGVKLARALWQQAAALCSPGLIVRRAAGFELARLH